MMINNTQHQKQHQNQNQNQSIGNHCAAAQSIFVFDSPISFSNVRHAEVGIAKWNWEVVETRWLQCQDISPPWNPLGYIICYNISIAGLMNVCSLHTDRWTKQGFLLFFVHSILDVDGQLDVHLPGTVGFPTHQPTVLYPQLEQHRDTCSDTLENMALDIAEYCGVGGSTGT